MSIDGYCKHCDGTGRLYEVRPEYGDKGGVYETCFVCRTPSSNYTEALPQNPVDAEIDRLLTEGLVI